MRAPCDETLVFNRNELPVQPESVQTEFMKSLAVMQSHAVKLARFLDASDPMATAIMAPGFCVVATYEVPEGWSKGLLSPEDIPLATALTLINELT